MFLAYSELLNSLDSAATTKLTICNRRQSQADFEQSVLMSMREDGLDKYRKEYNQMLIDKATGAPALPPSAPSAWNWTPLTDCVFSTTSTGPGMRAAFILIWRIWHGWATTSRTISARTVLRSTATI